MELRLELRSTSISGHMNCFNLRIFSLNMLEKSGEKDEHCSGIPSQVVTDYNEAIEYKSSKETVATMG